MASMEPLTRITSKQRTVLKRSIAFCQDDFNPTDEGIMQFFAYVDKGKLIEHPDAITLLDAWRISNVKRNGLSLQQEMWLDGHLNGDFTLGNISLYYLADALYNPSLWERKLPAMQHLCQLKQIIGSCNHAIN
jgi:hypothetical protein